MQVHTLMTIQPVPLDATSLRAYPPSHESALHGCPQLHFPGMFTHAGQQGLIEDGEEPRPWMRGKGEAAAGIPETGHGVSGQFPPV